MSDTFWVDFFKYLLPVLSGVLGILGILNVFKTSHNRLSSWGWIAVVIIVFSTIAGFFISKKEKEDNEREKEKLQVKLDRLMFDLVKIKQPIGDVKLTFWSVLPDSIPEVMGYKNYIKDKIKKRVRDNIYSKPPKVDHDLDESGISSNNEVIQYNINNKSKYWPGSRFPELDSIASTFSLTLCINSKRVDLKHLIFVMGARGDTASLDWCAAGMLSGRSIIFYDVRKDKVGLMTTTEYDKNHIYSNGKITSVRDFYSADVFFSLPSSGSAYINKILISRGASKKTIEFQSRISQIINAITVEDLILDLGNGQSFQISGTHLKKKNTEMGTPYFYLTTPDNDNDMNKLQSKE